MVSSVLVAITVMVLAPSVTAIEKEEAIQWFFDVAAGLGMSEDGAMKLIEVLQKYEPDDTSKLPTVEEVDEIMSKLRPQVLADAKPLMSEDDFSKVEAMITKLHEAATEYIKSQKSR